MIYDVDPTVNQRWANILCLLGCFDDYHFAGGMVWAECKQAWEEGIWPYLNDHWNLMDLTMITFYTVHYIIEILVAQKQKTEGTSDAGK